MYTILGIFKYCGIPSPALPIFPSNKRSQVPLPDPPIPSSSNTSLSHCLSSNPLLPQHLRMKVSEAGCQIQYLNFSSVEKMIEHFKSNPIQLDSSNLDSTCNEVYLADYIPSDLQLVQYPVYCYIPEWYEMKYVSSHLKYKF